MSVPDLVHALGQLEPILFAEIHCQGDLEWYVVLTMWDHPNSSYTPEELQAQVSLFVRRVLGWRIWTGAKLFNTWGLVRLRKTLEELVGRGVLVQREDPRWGRVYLLPR